METTLRNLTVVFFVGSVLLLGFNNCSNNFQVQASLDGANLPSAAGNPGGNTGGNNGGNNGSPDPGVVAPMPTGFSANSLQVCMTGCPYTLPSQAANVVKDNEVIEIMSGDYNDCMSLHANRIVVRGVGKTRPHIHSKICDGKGVITNYGNTNRIENFEISDFSNSDFNGAAVRQDVSAKDVILSNLFIHDGQMGIFGGSPGDRIRADHVEFKSVGFLRPDGEISVPVYIVAGNLLSIRASKFSNAVGGASFVKARPNEVIIDCSSIANLDSEDSYNVDYQTGGKLSIFNSVIEQSDKTQNFTMIGVNSVSFNGAIENSMTLKGNIILNDSGRGTMVNIFKQAPAPMVVENNIFVGGGTIFSNNYAYGPSNQVLAARPASYGAYPQLPAPGNCLTSVPQF